MRHYFRVKRFLSGLGLTTVQVAFNIIEEELGQPLEAVFSKISSQTIAAASLGQVYRATLRDSGEDVAIKVVRGLLLLLFGTSMVCE